MKYAIVESGVVVNVVRSDAALNDNWIAFTDDVDIGHIWNGSSFSAPPVKEKSSDELLSELKNQRQTAVNNIVVNVDGMNFDGDEISQTRMARAILVMQSASVPTISWVLHDNTVQTVTVYQLINALAAAGAEQARLWVTPYAMGA